MTHKKRTAILEKAYASKNFNGQYEAYMEDIAKLIAREGSPAERTQAKAILGEITRIREEDIHHEK